jgi:hypothetical protein
VALITAQEVTTAGVAPSYGAVSASDTFANDGTVVLHVKNAGGSSDSVTIVSTKACDQGTTHNVVVSVPATTGDRLIGPFSPARFNDPTTGLVTVQHSFTTSVTQALLRSADVR